jgi:hypothetical protein
MTRLETEKRTTICTSAALHPSIVLAMMRAHRIDHHATSTEYKRTQSMHEDRSVGKRIKMVVRTVGTVRLSSIGLQ